MCHNLQIIISLNFNVPPSEEKNYKCSVQEANKSKTGVFFPLFPQRAHKISLYGSFSHDFLNVSSSSVVWACWKIMNHVSFFRRCELLTEECEISHQTQCPSFTCNHFPSLKWAKHDCCLWSHEITCSRGSQVGIFLCPNAFMWAISESYNLHLTVGLYLLVCIHPYSWAADIEMSMGPIVYVHFRCFPLHVLCVCHQSSVQVQPKPE